MRSDRALAASDPRIRLIRMLENGGPGHARNQALQAARGRWIAVLDADDVWAPTRLRRLLDASDDRDLVFDNLMGFDLHAGHATGPIFPLLPPARLTLEDLLAPTAPGTTYDFGYLQPLMRTAFLREHNIAYVPELRANEDLVLSVTALIARARTATVPDPLYIYTTPVGGQSGRPSSASKTVPGVSPVCRVLLEVMERNASVLTAAEQAAFTLRLDHILRSGPSTCCATPIFDATTSAWHGYSQRGQTYGATFGAASASNWPGVSKALVAGRLSVVVDVANRCPRR